MTKQRRRVGIYVRVSTDDGRQTTENQERVLRSWAELHEHEVVEVFRDNASGAKGREKRPGFDALLKAAAGRRVNTIAVWSSDRLGRSLKHLIEVLEMIDEKGIDLYVHTQSIDTTTPGGRAMFQMIGVFGEFERETIRARVNAGLDRVKAKLKDGGKHRSKAGNLIDRLGRPGASPEQIEAARAELAKGTGILKTARLTKLGTSTVQALAEKLRAAA